jgi:outer membrane protein assembly factor BamD (BamD/ComL family)
MTAEEYYNKGKEFQRAGNWQEAIHFYNEAVALDADSPAAEAKKMVMSILEYYCKDMYNP